MPFHFAPPVVTFIKFEILALGDAGLADRHRQDRARRGGAWPWGVPCRTCCLLLVLSVMYLYVFLAS